MLDFDQQENLSVNGAFVFDNESINKKKQGDQGNFLTHEDNKNQVPLAHQLRPKDLSQFIGQDHLVSRGKPLFKAINNKELFSFILWGPPGVGKTSLARIYAKSVGAVLFELSAVSAGKDDVRKIVKQASGNYKKILFLDEIHRFNKAQQDFLLPYVESGELTLIGATTENPSFEVISALLSRCQLFVLKPLKTSQLESIIQKAGVSITSEASDWLIAYAQGDARKLLGALDIAKRFYKTIDLSALKESLQENSQRYDKKGEQHYDTISAFIKSMRASQTDAALYYLARMVKSGEDPKFIARRMVIFASEDIGLALPTALVVANAVFRAVETIGYPEASINLAHGVTYLCQAPKSRASYNAYKSARDAVEKFGPQEIPLHIRNAVTPLMKEMGYGKGYKIYNKESYLPEKIKHLQFFTDKKE